MTKQQHVMERRWLGSSGLSVSALGVGCWPIGGPATNLGLPMGWSTAADNASLSPLMAPMTSSPSRLVMGPGC